MQGVEFFGRLSFLKAGLNYAAQVATVSATYAEEITRPEFGCGLDGLSLERASQGRLTGIVNGVDESWDPRQDRKCPYLYDPQRWKGRYADYVRGMFGLSLSRAPCFRSCRGWSIKRAPISSSTRPNSSPNSAATRRHGARRAGDGGRVRRVGTRRRDAVGVRIGFDAEDARALFAGSDFVLMPSRFEPCGLSQMYAQRFGAIPIARRTGGLGETIHDGKTGFLFDRPNVADLDKRSVAHSRSTARASASTNCAAPPWRSSSTGTIPRVATPRSTARWKIRARARPRRARTR